MVCPGTYPKGCLIKATCEQTYDVSWTPQLPFDWSLIQACARAKTQGCGCPEGYVEPVQNGAAPMCVKYPPKDVCVKPCTCNNQDMKVSQPDNYGIYLLLNDIDCLILLIFGNFHILGKY